MTLNLIWNEMNFLWHLIDRISIFRFFNCPSWHHQFLYRCCCSRNSFLHFEHNFRPLVTRLRIFYFCTIYDRNRWIKSKRKLHLAAWRKQTISDNRNRCKPVGQNEWMPNRIASENHKNNVRPLETRNQYFREQLHLTHELLPSAYLLCTSSTTEIFDIADP